VISFAFDAAEGTRAVEESLMWSRGPAYEMAATRDARGERGLRGRSR